jgi:hypothetical protein
MVRLYKKRLLAGDKLSLLLKIILNNARRLQLFTMNNSKSMLTVYKRKLRVISLIKRV